MKTKKIYECPAMSAMELQSSTLLAGSNESFYATGTVGGRGSITDPDDEDEEP